MGAEKPVFCTGHFPTTLREKAESQQGQIVGSQGDKTATASVLDLGILFGVDLHPAWQTPSKQKRHATMLHLVSQTF
jgi:hypothetical protein